MPKITLVAIGKRLERIDKYGHHVWSEDKKKGTEEEVVELKPTMGEGTITIPKSMIGECEIGDKYIFSSEGKNIARVY